MVTATVCLAGGAPEWRSQAGRAAVPGWRVCASEADGRALSSVWNEAAAGCGGEWIVFCSPGALPRDDAWGELAAALESSPAEVGAVEMRTLPWENPKFYHPLTLETRELDGACFAVRRAAFETAGGFPENGADPAAALSRALRDKGFRIRVAPRAVAVTQSEPPRRAGFQRANAPVCADAVPGVHFTVLIRAYRCTDTLGRALTCLEHQTHRDFDVIVAEDGEHPVCADTVRAHEKTLALTYLPLGRGAGRSAAANAAMEAAKGPWLVFLDDDDYFFADHLEVLAQTVRENPGCSMAASAAVEAAAAADTAEYAENMLENRVLKEFSMARQCMDNAFAIQSVAFRKELFEQMGGMDEALDALEDWDLWTRYLTRAKIALCEKATSLYHTPQDFCERMDRVARMDEWKAQLLKKWGGYRFEVSAADILAASWTPQREACENAKRVYVARQKVDALQRSRRRQSTRALRGALNGAARALVQITGPDDVDVEQADGRALLEQERAIEESLILRKKKSYTKCK